MPCEVWLCVTPLAIPAPLENGQNMCIKFCVKCGKTATENF